MLLGERPFSIFFQYGLCCHTVLSASDGAYDCPDWRSWSDIPTIFLRRRPLTTLGRPTPTAVADSQWGEPRSEAFATDARVAGSKFTVAGLAALKMGNR